MSEVESYSFDNVKLMVAGICLICVCLTGPGIIPVGILLLGLIISIKGGDVKNIMATTRFVQGLILLAAVVLVGMGFEQHYSASQVHGKNPYDDPQYSDVIGISVPEMISNPEIQDRWVQYKEAQTYYDNSRSHLKEYLDRRNFLWLSAVGMAISALLLGYLWLGPLERRFERMRQAAEDFANRERKEKKTPPPSIYNREAMTSYSTAEELRKWRDLYTDGAITRREFEEARAKILKQG